MKRDFIAKLGTSSFLFSVSSLHIDLLGISHGDVAGAGNGIGWRTKTSKPLTSVKGAKRKGLSPSWDTEVKIEEDGRKKEDPQYHKGPIEQIESKKSLVSKNKADGRKFDESRAEISPVCDMGELKPILAHVTRVRKESNIRKSQDYQWIENAQ